MRMWCLIGVVVFVLVGSCAVGEGSAKAVDKGTRQANRKRIHEARTKFLELYRKAKKPKSGPGRVVGFVVDSRDFSPIEGAVISGEAAEEKRDDEQKHKSAPKAHQTISEKEGVYELEGLKPGRYTLQAAAEGYKPYERKNIFVKPGCGPGLGRWLVIQMRRPSARKGGLLGELKFIEPSLRYMKVLVTETADGWDDIKEKEIVLFSGMNEGVMRSMKVISVGDTVECHFVKRSTKYILLDVSKEEKE